MKSRFLVVASIASISCFLACGDDDDASGGAAPEPAAAPFGLDARPPNPTCKAPPRLYDPDGIQLESTYDALKFDEPTQLILDPINNKRAYVVERAGIVKVFPNEHDTKPDAVKVMIDIKADVHSEFQESGLLGMAFDPGYETNHYVYLSYTSYGGGKIDLGSVIVRYETNDDGATLDPTSKELVFGPLEQPFENHNGGHILFGPDNFLYYGLGDGGDGGDPNGNGQNKDVLFGKLLRIDVSSLPYKIPPTNPFANGGGAPEIYAYGLRNPWRFTFDKANGDLWLGDVGEDTVEEIDRIVLGGNYGWNTKEGRDCLEGRPCSSEGLIDPVVQYGHDEGQSVVGGFVYRGHDLPKLVGSYFYADTITGALWALSPEPNAKPKLLNPNGPNPSVVSFAADGDGELFVVSFVDGKIYKIVPPDPQATGATFPQTLSKTGCFDPADTKKPGAALIPYGVNSQLWSDGAKKERFFAIPDGDKISINDDGDFDFPSGTVVVKTFFIEDKRIETRLFVHHDDGAWGGYTYEWNDAETDATLLPVAGKTKHIANQEWTYPSRGECMRCHTDAAGRTLGLELGELNGDFVYSATNRRSNQIDTLNHLDMFDKPRTQQGAPRIPRPDDEAAAPLEARAKAYLHGNCSMCHRPGGTSQGGMDFRFVTPLHDMRICNQDPSVGNLGVEGAKIFAAGDPIKSIMAIRAHATEKNRMPPLATRIVDPTGTHLIDDWIKATPQCP